MNLRDYIATFGGHIGLITFFSSIIICFTVDNEISLIVNTITLFTLNPYVVHQSYWESKGDYSRISLKWLGKFGTLISLVSLINLIWYSYLVYSNSNSILLAIGIFLFIILILPTILSYIMIKKNEFKY